MPGFPRLILSSLTSCLVGLPLRGCASHRARPLSAAVSNRLAYPRLASCDVGYFAGPPCAAASAAPVPTPFVSSNSSTQALLAGFAVEEKSLRTTELVRQQWAEEGAARAQRKQHREAALNARAIAEANAARVAEEARQAALAEQRRRDELAAIAAEEARKLAAAEAAKLAAEAAKLAAEGEELAARQRDYERRMQERNAQLASPPGSGIPAMPIAHPVGSHPPAPAAAAAAVAAPGPGVGASSLYSSSLPAAPTPQQAAFQRSFQELTGVANLSQISMLLTLLNHDLDRAIAVFFSEDPPSMVNALEKARSIQANAQQQQQQQQQQQAAQHHVSPLASMQVAGGGGAPGQPAYIPAYRQYFDAHGQPQPQAQPMQPQPMMGHPSQPTQLKVLLPDGSPFTVHCSSSDTMWTLYEQLSAPLSSRPQWANKPIVFALTTYPNTVYNENRWDTTMQEAGLVPQGTLKIELCK